MKDLDGTSKMSQLIFSIQITFSVWLQHRGKKTGQELIKSLVALSKEKKCYKITLITHKETIPFYTRLGFNNEQYQMVLKH